MSDANYTIDEKIRYWEDVVLSNVYKLDAMRLTDTEYIGCVKKIQYATKRLEMLKFLKLREHKPLEK